MAYDEKLAARVRDLLADVESVSERKMFGGLAFLVGGHMAVAASGRGGLMARVDPESADVLLERAHVEPMIMSGRPADGWVRVLDDGVRTKKQLSAWVDRSLEYVRTLPPKR